MQGRSLKDNEVTQEINDQTRSFRVIGSDRYVFSENHISCSQINLCCFFCNRLIVLQSRPSLSLKSSDTDDHLLQSMSALTTTPFSFSPCDLHILMGHENT